MSRSSSTRTTEERSVRTWRCVMKNFWAYRVGSFGPTCGTDRRNLRKARTDPDAVSRPSRFASGRFLPSGNGEGSLLIRGEATSRKARGDNRGGRQTRRQGVPKRASSPGRGRDESTRPAGTGVLRTRADNRGGESERVSNAAGVSNVTRHPHGRRVSRRLPPKPTGGVSRRGLSRRGFPSFAFRVGTFSHHGSTANARLRADSFFSAVSSETLREAEE